MTLSAESTVRDLMERGKVSICGGQIVFTVDDLSDDEFDCLYDLMYEVYGDDTSTLRVAQ